MLKHATLCFALLVAPLPVWADDLAAPDGVWEISTEDSRYEVELCGEDGTDLCGTLIWLAEGADTPENAQYLDTMIIDHASAIGENRWRGQLNLFGHSATGTITQTDDDTIELDGCALLVICRTYVLHRS